MMVSVCMITYGHEKYIKEAVEGVLMQECVFEVELIIADDCSPDETNKIVRNIEQKHPNGSWITYTRHATNKGMIPNFIFALQTCSGKYIALCEGDDYWTDPLKLQKQVDFLENNLDFNYCGHRSSVLNNNTIKPIVIDNEVLKFSELVYKNILNTSTLVFKRTAIQNFPSLIKSVNAADWALQLIAIKDSKAKILSDYMSVYRIHKESIWSSLSKKEMGKKGISTLKKMKLLFNSKKELKQINRAILYRKKEFGLDFKSRVLDFIKSVINKMKAIFK